MSLQLLTLATGAAGLALVGLFYNSNAAYFMCAALLAVLVVSFASSRVSARAFAWRRGIVDRVFENEPFLVTLEVTNRGKFPLFMLKIADTLPAHVTAIEAPSFVVPALWPGESTALRYHARAAKRGVFPLGPLQVSVSDPFGVFPRLAEVRMPGEAVIFPRPIVLSTDLGGAGLELKGAITGERSRAAEAGLDFYGIRDYQPGDDLRRIHWPATAHHGKLVVIEFERGVSGSVCVVLDTYQGSEYGSGLDTTLETGVKAAASLLHWVLTNEGVACLAVEHMGEVGVQQTDRTDEEQELLAALAWARAEGPLTVSGVAEWAGPKSPVGAQVVVITAQPDPGLAPVTRWLIDAGAAVTVLLIDPQSYGGPLLEQAQVELKASGAEVSVYRRGTDLKECLDGVLHRWG